MFKCQFDDKLKECHAVFVYPRQVWVYYDYGNIKYLQGNSKGTGPVLGQFLHQYVYIDLDNKMCKTASRIRTFT